MLAAAVVISYGLYRSSDRVLRAGHYRSIPGFGSDEDWVDIGSTGEETVELVLEDLEESERSGDSEEGPEQALDLDTGAEASFLHKTDPGAEEAGQTEPEDSSEKKESGTQEAGAEETERKESETQESERKESETQEAH